MSSGNDTERHGLRTGAVEAYGRSGLLFNEG